MTTTSLPSGQTNIAYPGATLASYGGTAPVTWAVTTGKLPAGLNLTSSGTITGTTVTGTTVFTVTATDSSTPTSETAKAKLSITVNGPARATTRSLPTGLANSPYAGADPRHLHRWFGPGHLGRHHRRAARRTDPRPDDRGDHRDADRAGRTQHLHRDRHGLQLPDGGDRTATESITVTSPPLAVITAALPNGAVGLAYGGATLASTGGSAPVTWAVTSGKLPPGLALNASSGAITGMPTAGDSPASP